MSVTDQRTWKKNEHLNWSETPQVIQDGEWWLPMLSGVTCNDVDDGHGDYLERPR